MSLFDDYVAPVNETELEAMKRKANEAKAFDAAIKEQEEGLKELKARFREITENELPELMSNAGLSEFVLEDGSKIKVTDFISAKLPKDETMRNATFAWLVDHEAGDIIKTDVTAVFAKKEHNSALHLASKLREDGYTVEEKTGVHHQTFNAFLRERLEKGEDLPSDDICPVYIGRKVKL